MNSNSYAGRYAIEFLFLIIYHQSFSNIHRFHDRLFTRRGVLCPVPTAMVRRFRVKYSSRVLHLYLLFVHVETLCLHVETDRVFNGVTETGNYNKRTKSLNYTYCA